MCQKRLIIKKDDDNNFSSSSSTNLDHDFYKKLNLIRQVSLPVCKPSETKSNNISLVGTQQMVHITSKIQKVIPSLFPITILGIMLQLSPINNTFRINGMANRELNYYPPIDQQMKDFIRLCEEFCKYTIDKEKEVVIFMLDTPAQEKQFELAFEGFNWND